MTFAFDAIGFVSAGRSEVTDDEWGGCEACITLTDSFEPSALAGIDGFSHVEVLFLFDRVAPEKVLRGSRHPRNNPDWPEVGIFAQRTKNRPNRIGSTICRVLRREASRLFVAELDAIDGTPIIDLKPVMRQFLPRGPFSQPVWADELMARYWTRPADGAAPGLDQPVPTHGLTHVSLSVADPERSFQFYRRLFGVEELYRDENSVQALGPGPHDVLAFERRAGHGQTGGIDHIGFRLVSSHDIAHAIEAAKSIGATIVRSGEFGPNQPYLYIQDPDGYVLEIWYE